MGKGLNRGKGRRREVDKTDKVLVVWVVVFVLLSSLFVAWVDMMDPEMGGREATLVMFGIGGGSFFVSYCLHIGTKVRGDATVQESGDSVTDYAGFISQYQNPSYPDERYPRSAWRYWIPPSVGNPLERDSGCKTMVAMRAKLRSGDHVRNIGPIRRSICEAAVKEWERVTQAENSFGRYGGGGGSE